MRVNIKQPFYIYNTWKREEFLTQSDGRIAGALFTGNDKKNRHQATNFVHFSTGFQHVTIITEFIAIIFNNITYIMYIIFLSTHFHIFCYFHVNLTRRMTTVRVCWRHTRSAFTQIWHGFHVVIFLVHNTSAGEHWWRTFRRHFT